MNENKKYGQIIVDLMESNKEAETRIKRDLEIVENLSKEAETAAAKVADKKKKLKIAIIIAVAVVIIVAGIASALYFNNDARAYRQAEKLASSGSYAEAAVAFENLEDYKDSSELALENHKAYIDVLIGEGMYVDAYEYQKANNVADYEEFCIKQLAENGSFYDILKYKNEVAADYPHIVDDAELAYIKANFNATDETCIEYLKDLHGDVFNSYDDEIDEYIYEVCKWEMEIVASDKPEAKKDKTKFKNGGHLVFSYVLKSEVDGFTTKIRYELETPSNTYAGYMDGTWQAGDSSFVGWKDFNHYHDGKGEVSIIFYDSSNHEIGKKTIKVK